MPLALAHPAHRPTLNLWSRLSSALLLYRSRRSLVDLDDHMLEDIGISRDEALSEARRPVWDAPARWRR
jgi:uncharacterized protein YjiS (DUF1127 family)